MEKKITYIERQKPFWFRIIAAIFFTIAIGLIIYFFTSMDLSFKGKRLYAHFDLLQYIFALIFFAVYFSYTINCHFNFEEKIFKREITIGIFAFGKWKPLSEIEYVSIFAVNENTFQINLFYKKNRHWDLYEKFDFKSAFTIAFELSELLNIDLLDATIPNDFKWIDKIASKESGKLIHIE